MTKAALLLVALGCLMAMPAHAKEDAAPKPYIPPALKEKSLPENNAILPPLYGWTRIVLHDLKINGSDEAVSNCGIKKDMIFQFFANHLQEAGLPVLSEAQAAGLIAEDVVVEAEPTITPLQDLVINCISNVQFRVKVDVTFRVPPLMYRRTVPLLLWDDSSMVSSAKSTHNNALINTMITMTTRFRDVWRKQNGQPLVDQPVMGK